MEKDSNDTEGTERSPMDGRDDDNPDKSAAFTIGEGDGGSRFLWNVSTYLPDCTVSHRRRSLSSQSPPENLKFYLVLKKVLPVGENDT